MKTIEAITSGAGQDFRIPDPRRDSVGEAGTFYTKYYETEKEDSPPVSRTSLITRSHPDISLLSPRDVVLELGAGRQIVMAEYIMTYGQPNCTIVTLDIASLGRTQLLVSGQPHLDSPKVAHAQASGHRLPFADETLSGVMSNMAFDFMPVQARSELLRVVKPRGFVFLNLHHPSLIPSDLDRQLRTLNKKMAFSVGSNEHAKKRRERLEMKRAVLEHKKYLRDNNLLFSNPEDVHDIYASLGFIVQKISLNEDKEGKWWEIDMQKPR